MSDDLAFTGEIRAFPFGFAPRSWAPCDGSLLVINQYSALFSIIGLTYGGSVVSGKFALPNLVGAAAMMQGTGPGLPTYALGQKVGADWVTLSPEQTAHSHMMTNKSATKRADKKNAPLATGMVGGVTVMINPGPPPAFQGPPSFAPSGTPNTAMDPSSIVPTGAGQPHWNAQPFLVLSYCICLDGIYPTTD